MDNTAKVEDDEDEDEDSDNDEEDDEDDIEAAIAASRRRMGSGDCLFCTHQSSDIAANVTHMASIHSFFIPDQDILFDLPGLLAYLGEKVAVGNLCLFCPNGGKEFGSVEAVRKHMIDKCHCKVAYETNEDRAELADFYDFGGVEGSDWEDVDEDDMDDDEVCVSFSKWTTSSPSVDNTHNGV
jgi:pre-60S factor REI1